MVANNSGTTRALSTRDSRSVAPFSVSGCRRRRALGGLRRGPGTEFWSGRRDSNPRRPPWQGGTLPLSYSRAFCGASKAQFSLWRLSPSTSREPLKPDINLLQSNGKEHLGMCISDVDLFLPVQDVAGLGYSQPSSRFGSGRRQGGVAKWLRRRSAKPLLTGSTPVAASSVLELGGRRRSNGPPCSAPVHRRTSASRVEDTRWVNGGILAGILRAVASGSLEDFPGLGGWK